MNNEYIKRHGIKHDAQWSFLSSRAADDLEEISIDELEEYCESMPYRCKGSKRKSGKSPRIQLTPSAIRLFFMKCAAMRE